MALTTVSSDRLSTNVKTSNLGTELKKKVGQNKNLIINGAMQVAQRATSSTTNGYGDLDRWKHEYGTVNENPTFAQVSLTSSDTPYTFGLTKATKITNGNQTSGLQATSIVNFMQAIEAQDIRNSGWNYTSSSSYITLSFWVRASVAQNYHGFIKTADGTNYAYPFELGSLSANTWTKITKTIPGNSNLTINDDNGAGLQIFPITFLGTGYTDNSITNDAWMTWASATRTKDQTSTWFTTDDATFEITGVQLEVGSVATDFEHRSFAQELALCQRYFFGHSGGSHTVNGSNSSTPDTYLGTCSVMSTSGLSFNLVLPVPMRAVPTLYSTVTGSTRYRVNSAGANANSGSDPVIFTNGSSHILVAHDLSGFSGLQSGQSGNIRRYLGSGVLGFQAEL